MKKVIILFAAFLFAWQLQAQDISLLNRIKEVNGKLSSFEADLSNTLVKKGKSKTQVGKLYYVKPNEFAAQFTSGKYTIANEKQIKMDIGIFHGSFSLKKGGRMQSLANIFLYGFQGKVQDLANENDYNVTSTRIENGCHVVTSTAKREPLIGMGYKNVIYKYHTESLLLKEIVLVNFNGSVDTYTISNVKYDIPVDKKTFQF